MTGKDDDIILRLMREADTFKRDTEKWHGEADSVLCECLLLDVSMDMRKALVKWFDAAEKWYA